MTNIKRTSAAITAGLALLASACANGDSIDEGGATFAAISEQATINLLGNEPFWGIEITPSPDDGFVGVYSTPDNIDGTIVSLDRFAGNNGLGFSGELDGAAMQIAVTPGECSDGMSDRSYPYTATVTVGDQTLLGCAYTSDELYTEEGNA